MAPSLYTVFYEFRLMPILVYLICNNRTSIIKRNKMQEDDPPYFIPLWVWNGSVIRSPIFMYIYSPSYRV